jgi:uncharacterized repeat protein (TIGR01451 family)
MPVYVCNVDEAISSQEQKMRRLPYFVLLLVACLTNAWIPQSTLRAQGWINIYPRFVVTAPTDLLQFPNGDYLLTDNHSYMTGATSSILCTASRIDPNGDTIWTKPMGFSQQGPNTYFAFDAELDYEGGFVLIGSRKDSSFQHSQATLKHIDDSGQLDWAHDLVPGEGLSVIQALDGGYIIGGIHKDSLNLATYDDYFIAKTDAQGSLVWMQTLPFQSRNYMEWTTWDETIRILETPSHDLLVMSQSDSLGANHGTFLVKTDAQGVIQWQREYWQAPDNNAFWATDMCVAPNGGLAMVGKDSNDVALFVLTDSLGNIQQYRTDAAYDGNTYGLSSICPTVDGGYLVGGGRRCTKLDAAGNIMWYKEMATSAGIFPQVLENDNHELLFAFSYIHPTLIVPQGSAVAKLDSLGHLYSNFIEGTVYADLDADCVQDSADIPVPNLLVWTTPMTFYATTDLSGHYEVEVDTGSYTLALNQLSNYFQVLCPASGHHTPTFTSPYDTISGLDFALDVFPCPVLQVEVNTPFLRRCSTSTYYASYGNLGIFPALNARVEVILDPWLTVTGASIPWLLPQVGDTFLFDVGTVLPFGSGDFQIYTTLSCDPNIIGMTHCVSAHIYPDTSCAIPDPQWDGASIAVEGSCINNDTVRFRIINQGASPMSSPGGLVILEDDILMMAGTFDLDAATDTIIDIPANGKTYALIAEQRPGHPGRSNPRAFVEACDTNSLGGFSTGHILTHAQDEADFFIAIDCDQNIGSYDPNDKQASPVGIGPNHYIAATDQLEYMIRFQNTGTDTAFKVIIRDQIDPHLDPLTFRAGVSSHPFTWRIHNSGEVEFTFNNILLPDSNVNAPASNGFVTYTIDQQPGNPDGTVIYNEADIYFDFNVPVRTNETFNEIASLPWSFLVYTIDVLEPQSPSVKVWPNPFSSTATIDLGERVYRNLDFELWDLSGRLVQRQSLHGTHEVTLQGAGLQVGMYIFKVVADGKAITGKIMLVN